MGDGRGRGGRGERPRGRRERVRAAHRFRVAAAGVGRYATRHVRRRRRAGEAAAAVVGREREGGRGVARLDVAEGVLLGHHDGEGGASRRGSRWRGRVDQLGRHPGGDRGRRRGGSERTRGRRQRVGRGARDGVAAA